MQMQAGQTGIGCVYACGICMPEVLSSYTQVLVSGQCINQCIECNVGFGPSSIAAGTASAVSPLCTGLLLQAVRDSEWEGRETARMRNGQEQVISLVTPYYDTCRVQVSMRWCSRMPGWTHKQWDMVSACHVGTMQ